MREHVAPFPPPVLLAALHMAAKKTPQKPSKSDFIRSQPASLSAADVVAKGKARGIKFSTQLVYNVRGGGSKAKKGTAKRTAKAKPTTTSKSPAKVSKADFVRARSHLSPKEIVEDGKAARIKVDVSYVYKVRGAAKGKGKKRVATKVRATPRTGVPVPRPITSTRSAEDLLKAVAAEIGLGRAIEQLQDERARVRAILRG
jgi:hypothetical protein